MSIGAQVEASASAYSEVAMRLHAARNACCAFVKRSQHFLPFKPGSCVLVLGGTGLWPNTHPACPSEQSEGPGDSPDTEAGLARNSTGGGL